jgi:hypothetical protein
LILIAVSGVRSDGRKDSLSSDVLSQSRKSVFLMPLVDKDGSFALLDGGIARSRNGRRCDGFGRDVTIGRTVRQPQSV